MKLISAAFLGGVAAGCVPSAETPLPTSTRAIFPTGTSTSLPVPKLTTTPAPQPSPTPEAADPPPTEPVTPVSGQDVLTQAQKERLYQASLRYLAGTELEAMKVARDLAYVQGDVHPGNMCGPLAVAILRDAGLLNPYIDLHEFWLLNPRTHQAILEKVFPPDRFEWRRFTESTQTFDFKAFPLKAGDFLYLYANEPGIYSYENFEHMLTVTRVDEQGRAYSVTNIETETGFYIGERMLYDPDEPGAGQLYDWIDLKNSHIGLTGFGGFLLLRFAQAVRIPDPLEITLAQEIDQVLNEIGGEWKILIRELDGLDVYSRRVQDQVHVASVIKLVIAILFLKSLENLGITDLPAALRTGTAGRTYQQLLQAMLVNSEEVAAGVLQNEIRFNQLNVTKTLAAWGLAGIDLPLRRASVHELGLMAEKLYRGELLGQKATQILLEILETSLPDPDSGLSVIRQSLPDGYHFFNKRGTIADGVMAVGDLAMVSLPALTGERVFVLGVFGYPGTGPITYEQLEIAIPQVAWAFWRYAQSRGFATGMWR